MRDDMHVTTDGIWRSRCRNVLRGNGFVLRGAMLACDRPPLDLGHYEYDGPNWIRIRHYAVSSARTMLLDFAEPSPARAAA